MQSKRVIELGNLKGSDPLIKTWEDVRLQLTCEFGEEAYSLRHIQRIYKAYMDDVYKIDTIEDITMEKSQLQDILREYKSMLRDKSKENALLQAVRDGLSELEPIPYQVVEYSPSDKYMTVLVSDWHIGGKHSNYLGEYNYEVAKNRIDRFATEVIKRIELHKPKEVLILNLNDLIEGNIHLSTRVQAEFDAVQQTIKAGELLSQFITAIANHANIVKVGQVLDNHSRINKNKREHIEAESFGKLVEYIMKERVSHPAVRYVGNTVDDNIGLTQLGQKRIAWVHGHLDNPNTVKNKLEGLVGLKLDYVFIAHRHHIHFKDSVFQVGSLKGTDEYAFNMRFSERPSQSIFMHSDYEVEIAQIYF